jgi:inosine-uridine nucleoside N-ribohydrolase
MNKLKHIPATVWLGLILCALPAAAQEKVILDSDYTTIGDDGQVGVMAMQLHAQGVINLLGITVVAGNQWLAQGVSDALKAVERMGLGDTMGVYAGARYPLVHDYKTMRYERDLYNVGGSWYRRPEPPDGELTPPPDGFARNVKVQPQHAVNFMIETVKKHPHRVTLLVIGPLTNIALAIRMAPEIVPLIKRIVYMGGAFEVRGNTTPAAEMNIWYDAEAARAVIREPIEQTFIPLDVTNKVQMNKAIFDQVTANKDHVISRLLLASGAARRFREHADATMNIYDTLALAYLLDPTYATEVVEMWVDVDTNWGPSYGTTLGYRDAQKPGANHLRKHKVVLAFDSDRFFKLYVDLLTRPVPVRTQRK